MKLTIFNVFLTLFAMTELIQRFLFTVYWQLLLKHMVGRISGRGHVAEGMYSQARKSPSGKFLVREVSVEELPFGEVSAWDLSMRTSVGELSIYQFISKTFSEELL